MTVKALAFGILGQARYQGAFYVAGSSEDFRGSREYRFTNILT